MKSAQPPRLATWILEHLTTGEHGLALSGDLCEQYHAGRSSAWYWRQVASACIVSWYRSFYLQRVMILFALLWSMLAPAWTILVHEFENRFTLLGHIWRMDWPWSTLASFGTWMLLNLVFVWAGMLVYLLPAIWHARRIDPRQVRRGILVPIAIFNVVYFGLFFLLNLLSFPGPSVDLRTSTPARAIFDMRRWAMAIRLPYLITLVCALWRPLPRLAIAKTFMGIPIGEVPPPNSTPVRSVDLEGMSGFLGFFVCAGLLNAAIVALLVCRLPATSGPSLLGTLTRAAVYVLLGASAGTLGAWFYWRRSASPFRLHAPLSFRLFALICAAGWVWVPAIILLSTQDSASAALLGGLLGCVIASGLRKSIPAEAQPANLAPPTSAIFSHAILEVPTELHGYVIAFCVYLAFYSYRNSSNLTAAALLATGAFLFLWNRTQSPAAITRQQLRRRAVWRLVRTALPAVLITAWALMLGVAHRNRIAALGAALANTASPDSIARPDSTLGGTGGYHSIILWPLPPKKQIIPPIPRPANYLGIDHSRPMVIRFDGNYWYFQPPDQRPGRLAHQAHGNPLLFDIHSNNRFPLFMEAHQRLIGPVRIDRCREIDLQIENKDNGPGSFSVSLLLGDSGYPGQPALALGQQPVISSQPGYFRFKLAPVTETLRFALPASPRIRKFDDITVMVIPEREHITASPKIAVDQFELLPR